MPTDVAVIVVFASASVIVAIQLQLFVCSAPTGPFLTNCLEPVLWKCSYGPWDHFMFSAKNVIWLGFCKWESTCLRKPSFPDDHVFAKLHHANGGDNFISLRIPCGNIIYFFDMTAPGSRVQAVGEAPRRLPRHPGGQRLLKYKKWHPSKLKCKSCIEL